MELIRLRILTRKSRIGIGTYANDEVGTLVAAAPDAIRYAYYHFESIDFLEDIKQEADIRIRIEKPGKNVDAFYENRRQILHDMTDDERLKFLSHERADARATRAAKHRSSAFGAHMSKGYMQRVNHGHQKSKWI